MREIKFKLWDKKEKVTYQSYDITLKLNAYFDGEGRIYTKNGDKNITNRFLKRQYTGLKDKNGQEIYDGAILEHSKGENYIVEWDKDGYWWVTSEENGCDSLWRWAKVSKVIGNIYENPELLK